MWDEEETRLVADGGDGEEEEEGLKGKWKRTIIGGVRVCRREMEWVIGTLWCYWGWKKDSKWWQITPPPKKKKNSVSSCSVPPQTFLPTQLFFSPSYLFWSLQAPQYILEVISWLQGWFDRLTAFVTFPGLFNCPGICLASLLSHPHLPLCSSSFSSQGSCSRVRLLAFRVAE